MKPLSGLKFSFTVERFTLYKTRDTFRKSQTLISKFVFIVTGPCPQKSVIRLLQSSTRTVIHDFTGFMCILPLILRAFDLNRGQPLNLIKEVPLACVAGGFVGDLC